MIVDIAVLIMYVNGEHFKVKLNKSQRVWPSYKKETAAGYKLRVHVKPVSFLVGEEYLEGMRSINRMDERTQRIAHIRRGHWHSYWLGPRDGERTYIRHWLPPIVVSGRQSED